MSSFFCNFCGVYWGVFCWFLICERLLGHANRPLSPYSSSAHDPTSHRCKPSAWWRGPGYGIGFGPQSTLSRCYQERFEGREKANGADRDCGFGPETADCPFATVCRNAVIPEEARPGSAILDLYFIANVIYTFEGCKVRWFRENPSY